MSARRVYCDPPLPAGEPPQVILEGDVLAYVAYSLRLAPGDALQLFDRDGRRCDAVVERIERRAATVRVVEWGAATERPDEPLPVTLLMALLKGKGFELVLQKATELGVTRVVPVVTARTVPELRGERIEARVERWQRICGEAARQCGRTAVPRVEAPLPLAKALVLGHGLRLTLWEGERRLGLRAALSEGAPEGVTVLVGPEGGLAQHEVDAAAASGYRPTSLGARVLRAETAPLAALVAIQLLLGDLGAPPA